MKLTHTRGMLGYIALFLIFIQPILAQEENGDPETLETLEAVEEVEDPIGVLPEMEVNSVFGLGMTTLETPRSVSVVTGEMIDQYGINSVNDVVSVTPGAFTSSFFGVDGAINLRGTIAETYFRGIKRIENPGNYPTPIGASQSIQVVRGPTPPTFGTGKISGYLNFVPKSARASTGKYLDGPTGQTSLTVGSWDAFNFELEVGGPLELGERDAGYYAYLQVLDADSYYENVYREQQVFQVSFDFEVSDTVRIETGGMLQLFEGPENAGWNRVTQDLIDNGTYTQGRGFNFDTNGDGFTSGEELYAADPFPGGAFFQPLYRFVGVEFGGPDEFIFGPLPPEAGLDPADFLTGETTTLNTDQVLVDPVDRGEAEPFLLYFDVIADLNPDLQLTNKSYFERLPDRFKFASYGLSQLMDVSLFENKTILDHQIDWEGVSMNNQYFLSYRHYDVLSYGDFWFEFFDRRDLSRGPSSADRILTAIQDSDQTFWSSQEEGTIETFALGAMTEIVMFENLSLLLGGRVDFIEAETSGYEFDDTAFNQTPLTALPPTRNESGEDEAFAFNISLSYNLESVRPYITYAESETLNTDQAGLLNLGRYAPDDSLLNQQDLFEVGIKAETLEGQLYTTLAYFRQETTTEAQFDRQESPAALAKGFEFETRWVPSEQFTLIATLSILEVENTPPTNSQFNFMNVATTGFDPVDLYGGVATGNVAGTDFPDKPQVPELVASLVGTYNFGNGFGVNAGITHIDETFSDRIQTILLPSATLVNLGVFYDQDQWQFSATVKNLTDERWFRGNFGTLFGGVTVLPELPTHWEARATYRF